MQLVGSPLGIDFHEALNIDEEFTAREHRQTRKLQPRRLLIVRRKVCVIQYTSMIVGGFVIQHEYDL